MRKVVFTLLLVVLCLAATSQTVSARASEGYLRFKGGRFVNIAPGIQQEVTVQFGARYQTLEDVAIVCHAHWFGETQTISIGAGHWGPFDIAINWYGQDLVFGAYRSAPTTDLEKGAPYHVSVLIDLAEDLPAYSRGLVGWVDCNLFANADFSKPVAQDKVFVRATPLRFRWPAKS
jgi:hypothetical protein